MSRSIRFLMAIVSLALIVVVGTGCQAALPPWQSPPAGGAYVVAVGKSPSTRSAAGVVHANLAAVMDRAAGDGARLHVIPIGERAAGAQAVDVDFKAHGTATSNDHVARQQHADAKQQAQAEVRRLLAGPAPRYSNDDLAALSDAGQQLQLMGDAGPKHLVVLDDLRQMGSGCDFYRERLTAAYIRSTLRRLGPEIPDLTGVEVTFAGAGVTRKGHPFNWKREHRIEAFWLAWAAAAHAKQVIYSMSTT